LVVEGETVSKGQPVMEADLERIRQAGLSPMVITVLSS
jgi:PTS system sucrose-specific IIC component